MPAGHESHIQKSGVANNVQLGVPVRSASSGRAVSSAGSSCFPQPARCV